LLNDHNVTVVGSDCYLTFFQLKGFVNMMDSKEIIEKYTVKLSTDESRIKLTASEMLELCYYTSDNKDGFIRKISNNKVDISIADNVILLSC
jgi:predicted HAD superfamily Cof-like phosphohydrolase